MGQIGSFIATNDMITKAKDCSTAYPKMLLHDECKTTARKYRKDLTSSNNGVDVL